MRKRFRGHVDGTQYSRTWMALAKVEVADDIIICQIKNTRSTFSLTAQVIIDPKNAGVSEKVIAYMMNPKPKAAAGWISRLF